MGWTDESVEALKQALEKEKKEGFACRDQWLQDSRDQTAQAWETRNKELDELWPQIHSKDAEIAQLKEHAELLLQQLSAAEARALRAETCLHGVQKGQVNPAETRQSVSELLHNALHVRFEYVPRDRIDCLCFIRTIIKPARVA